MIPALQFDPSSLTLWYDAHLIGRCRGRRELGLALEYAILGDDRALRGLIACVDDEWVQTRAANIASAVWHEKRHFLDFVTTNYGALRLRHFFEVYGNFGALATLSLESKRLLVPLDSNLDPVMREMMGIGELDPRVLAIAKAVANRKAMLAADRRPLETHFGLVDIGGEAIMEAIAYHVQHAKLHRVFGSDINLRVQRDHPGEHIVGAKYRWAYQMLNGAGILRARAHDQHDGMFVIDDAPLLPLCYGALAVRVWKQQQTRGEGVSSYLPAERMSSLIIEIRDRHPDFGTSSWDAAWDIVNAACKRIFGRTVLEETDADYALEEQQVERYRRSFTDEPFFKACVDLHEVRGRAIALLKQEPELFLDQGAWSDRMVQRTKPAVVVAATAGEIGTPPPGYQRLSGYAHEGTDYDEKPEARWWWAAMNTTWPDTSVDPDALCVTDLDAWGYVAAEYAPLAKLVYAGHNMRVMLGPELLGARIRFQHQSGIKLVLDPAFAYPRETHSVDWWYYITGCDAFRCELSSETVQKPDGYMLDAWDLRLRPGLRESMLGSIVDCEPLRFTFWRDWSPWLVSDEFREFVESFEADEAGLYETLS